MPKTKTGTTNYKITRLENGIVVASETLPDIRSASLGVYLDIGSRDEDPKTNGLAHLFEHMVFKGTTKHDALSIVKCFESTGGQVNAYTSKEQTCFYAKVVDTEVTASLSMLLEMVLESKFDATDLRKEKEVIIEEIKGGEDNPEDYVYDLFSQAYFDKETLGYPIAGSAKTVRGLSREHLLAHQKKAAQTMPVYVTAVGNVSHAQIVDITRNAFGLVRKKGSALPSTAAQLAKTNRFSPARTLSQGRIRHLIEKRPVNQVTAILGGPGYAWDHANRYALLLLNCVFGDGMSSKLFQSVRESLGLVYSIYSNPEFLINTGVYSIGFATEPKDMAKAIREINKQILAVKKEGLKPEELDFAKQNIRGSVLLGLESSSTRMSNLSRQLMYGQPGETIDKVLAKLDKVSAADIRTCVNDVFQVKRWASAAVVPTKAKIDIGKLLDF
jgi:predicted Zn-dependent peptidase